MDKRDRKTHTYWQTKKGTNEQNSPNPSQTSMRCNALNLPIDMSRHRWLLLPGHPSYGSINQSINQSISQSINQPMDQNGSTTLAGAFFLLSFLKQTKKDWLRLGRTHVYCPSFVVSPPSPTPRQRNDSGRGFRTPKANMCMSTKSEPFSEPNASRDWAPNSEQHFF